jgi:AcrR family transcriptional regulator
LADPESPRGRILAAARRSFAERGFEAASTRTIAERAGVNLAMVHYYFGSKEALYRRMLAAEMSEVFAVMAGALADRDRSPVNRLLDLVEGINRAFRDDPVRLAIVRHEMGQGAPHVLALAGDLGAAGPRGFRDALLEVIEEAQREHQLTAHDPRALAALLITSAYGPLMLEPMLQVVFDTPSLDAERWDRLLRGQRELLHRALVPSSPKESGS